MNNKIFSKVCIYTILVILTIVYLYPLFYVFNVSLKTEPEFIRNTVSITQTFHVENYIKAWERAKFGSYISNSLIYMTICTVLSLIMSIFLAFPISRNYLRFSKAIFSLFLAGLFLPDGTIPQFQMFLKLGLYNSRLGYMLGLITGGGVSLFFFVSYLKSIPRELDEAASIDGCGYFRYVTTVIIPLIKPAIASMGILYAINVWNDILRAIIYLSNQKLYPITRGLFVFSGQYNNEWTVRTAALIIVAAPLIILYMFLQRYIIDGAVAGAIKA